MADPQMERLIEEAGREVADKGRAASPEAILLTGLAWLASDIRQTLRDELHPNRTKREIVVKLGTPAVVGGGVVAIILQVLEKLIR